MATTTLSISVQTSDILDRIHRNLAIIGKRAKNTSGQALFTDLTTSTLEDPIFDDLLIFGAQNIASEIADVAKTYVETSGSQISFSITYTRWDVTTTPSEPDLSNALKGLITNYLYNFCLARYLSAIHPQLGEKYPPLFGQTYLDACVAIIQNIKSLAFLKRPAASSEHSYADVKKV